MTTLRLDPVSRYGLAVRAVLRDGAGDILLVQRSPRSATNPGRWEPPGGKVEAGERFDVALHREVREETGLEIVLDGPLGVAEQGLPGLRAIQLVMGARATGGDLRVSDEHVAAAWVPPARLLTLDLADWFVSFLEQDGPRVDKYARGDPHD